jgi:hypothetical protein
MPSNKGTPYSVIRSKPVPTPNVYRCVCDAEFTDTEKYNKHIALCLEAESYRRPVDEWHPQREETKP